jgi:hypothetical protein
MTQPRFKMDLAQRWWKKPVAVAAASATAMGAAWAVYDATLKPAPMDALVPEYAAAFGSGDARHVWDITSELRDSPEAKDGIRRMEKELGISVANDVLPWAGRAGAALLSWDPKSSHAPNVALFVEVRNPVQYYRTMTRLRTRLEHAATPYWKSTVYDGVPLRYGYLRAPHGRVPVSTAWLRGWMVVGVGNGTTKRIVDTWHGRKRSLATNAAWASALSAVPEDGLLRYGLNTGLLYRGAGLPGVPTELLDRAQSVTAAVMTDTPDGIRMDAASMPTSPASRAYWQKAARELPPVSANLMDRLPDDTFVAAATGNPGVWWDLYEPMFARMFGEAGSSGNGGMKAVPHSAAIVKGMKPVGDIIHRFEGGIAIGAAYNPTNGWGFVGVGDCATPESAHSAAEAIADMVESHHGKVEIGENGASYSLQGADAQSRLAPAWGTNGAYLTFASTRPWLASPEIAGGAAMPADSDGAQLVARGNFRFVTALMDQVAGFGKAPEGAKEAVTNGFSKSRLAEARWVSWSRISPNGTSKGVFELTGWPWREVLRSLAHPDPKPKDNV